MRNGQYATSNPPPRPSHAGKATLRLKISMHHANPTMWDPVAYRIKFTPHPVTKDQWCIYPAYDFSHCIIDSLEHIDYSLCTLEFEVRRDIYYWTLEQLGLYRPYVWEFSRLNLTSAMLSKRKIIKLVRGPRGGGEWASWPALVGVAGLHAPAAVCIPRRRCVPPRTWCGVHARLASAATMASHAAWLTRVAPSPVAASPAAALTVAASPVAASPVAASPEAASPVAASPEAASPVAASPVAKVVCAPRRVVHALCAWRRLAKPWSCAPRCVQCAQPPLFPSRSCRAVRAAKHCAATVDPTPQCAWRPVHAAVPPAAPVVPTPQHAFRAVHAAKPLRGTRFVRPRLLPSNSTSCVPVHAPAPTPVRICHEVHPSTAHAGCTGPAAHVLGCTQH
jgi:hypothetical protein